MGLFLFLFIMGASILFSGVYFLVEGLPLLPLTAVALWVWIFFAPLMLTDKTPSRYRLTILALGAIIVPATIFQFMIGWDWQPEWNQDDPDDRYMIVMFMIANVLASLASLRLGIRTWGLLT